MIPGISESIRRDGNTYITILPLQIADKLVKSSGGRNEHETQIRRISLPPFRNIVLAFFNFAYRICFSPFELRQGPTGEFHVVQWLPQQIICFGGTISSIFYRILEVWTELPQTNLEWNPVFYFNLFHRFINLLFNLNIWIALWFMKGRFLDIVEFYRCNLNHPTISRSQRKLSLLVIIIGITFAILVTIFAIIGTDILQKSRFDPVFLFKCFAAHSQLYSFCIEHLDCSELYDFTLKQMTTMEIFIAVIFTISRFLRKIMGVAEEILVLVGPLTLWVAVKDFVDSVVESEFSALIECQSWLNISKKYGDLNRLTDLVNRTFGPMLLTYTLTALFYFSIHLDEFLTVEDPMVKIKFLVYYALIISTFTISAEIARQISKLAPWISKNLQDPLLSEMSHRELTVILHEISSNRIGMSACGLFTVTYSVVAQMTGVIVTYFIITVQYREQQVK